MKRAAVKIARNTAALILVALGIVGIFVPIMPQVLFFVAAVFIADLERKTAFVRWVLSRRWVRKIGGEKLHRMINRRLRKPARKAG